MSRRVNADFLKDVPLFSLLTREQAQGLAERAATRRFRRGEVLVEQGAKSDALYILLTGRARVFTADERGREVTLAMLGPGAYVGEMSLIDHQPHSASVRAESQTDVLVLARADFAVCLPDPSSLTHALMHGLVQRLRGANQQIQSLALLDVQGRVARTLYGMSESVEGVRIIRSRVSRQRLAELVGASRETVGRVMKELESRGLIREQGNGWLVVEEHLGR